MIREDIDIDLARLDLESTRTNKLYSKYIEKYSIAQKNLFTYNSAYDKLVLQRSRYYLGTQTDDYYKEHGHVQTRIVKTELPNYLKADKLIIAAKTMIKDQEIILEIYEKTLRQIGSRNFEIKNIITWQQLHGNI